MADTSLVFNIVAKDMASSKFDKLKGKMKLVGIAAGVMALKFGKDSVDAYVEAEASQKKLQDALSRFPALADTNIDRLTKLNSKLALKTKFDDDATASGQAVLAQFGVTGKQLETLTPLMQDYAAKTGKDLPTAAGLMGKAFLGNTKSLKALGIDYKSTGNKAKDMKNIQALLSEKVGGFAAKEGKSAAGQAAILKNQFGELQESVGSKLVPVLTKLAGELLKVIGFVQRNSAVIGPLAAVLGAVAAGFWLVTAAQKALAVVTASSPLGLLVIALVALGVGLVLAYKKSETFRNIVQGAMRGVVAAFNWVVNAAKAVFGWIKKNWPLLVGILLGPIALAVILIVRHWSTIKEKVGNILSAIKDKASNVISGIVGYFASLPGKITHSIAGKFAGMFDGIKNAFRSAINFLISGWNNLSFHIPGFDPPGPGPKFGGVTIDFPNIPYLAKGGIVTSPTLAVLGERGPEAVIPLGGGGMGATYNVTINMPAGSDGADVVEKIRTYVRRNGKLRGITA